MIYNKIVTNIKVNRPFAVILRNYIIFVKTMRNTGNAYLHKTALWKWITLFVTASIGAFILYGLAYGPTENLVPDDAILTPLLLFSACALLLLVHRWLSGQFEDRKVTELKMSRLLPDIGRGFGMGTAVFAAVALIMWMCGVYRIESIQFDWKGLWLSFAFFAVVAVGEELCCRGVMQRMIEARWGTVPALITASLIFGFLHYGNDNSGVWPCLAIAFMAVEGASFFYSGNLWMPIGVHWGWNFAQGNIFGMAVSGGDMGSSMITATLNGPYILTGGGFGGEASIITFVLSTALAGWLIYEGVRKGHFVPSRKKIRTFNMQRTYEFIKACGTYFLATTDGSQPKVRPFGTINIFDGKLYIQTGHRKDVAKQIKKNPKVELCCCKDGEWLRLSGVLVEDERIEARKAMLDSYPELRSMYDENDGNTAVYWFKDATARFCSFTKPEEEVVF